jgi:hypothetical protein
VSTPVHQQLRGQSVVVTTYRRSDDMTATRLLTSTAQLATSTIVVAATLLLVPLNSAADAASSPVASIPAPDGCAPPQPRAIQLDDLIAQRKEAWAADRAAQGLL